ncbi:MAG: tetratricopeptide repeat protein, partial [Allosphingosinicella sp.]
GLGNALVVHADGMMTPAAQLAFQRAAQLAPDHPGPRFFYGLSLAQGGQYDEAERIWRALLASAPADASYRPVVEERLRALQQARALGQIPGPSSPTQ